MKILILGCGWVGEECAKKMAQNGAEIWVTTTSADKAVRLAELGLHAQCLDFDQPHVWDTVDFPASFDYVLTSVPATARSTGDILLKRFARVKALLGNLVYKRHIFLSSVGVYPDRDGVFEESYIGELTPRLYRAEQTLLELPRTVVYRLGGLFGKNRVFARYFANRICTTGDQPANFVHLDDVVALIALGFENLQEDGVYNVVCPVHPTKKEVILASAAKHGFDLPSQFEPEDSFQKKVVSDKIVKALGYQFVYNSPLDF